MVKKNRKFSNCLIEAIGAKLRSPCAIQIKTLVKDGSVHFYWYDRRQQKHFAFHALNRNLPNWRKVWFAGRVQEYRWHDGASH
ncbi:MAG: hypothetical protein ACO3NK_17165 [Prochlorotrichaceae cyanobacterium]